MLKTEHAPGAGLLEFRIARFIDHMSKCLPDDVEAKIHELSAAETLPLAKEIYATMLRNLKEAKELDRPCCQDTGVLQFFLRCGTQFPYLDDLEELLVAATKEATKDAPLRPNAVETFEETNTGTNTGTGVPAIHWEIVPHAKDCEIAVYMAGGGCSLPGAAKVLMPSEGYEGVAKFVFERVTDFGINACPPLLVGVGIATNVDTAAVLSKKALLRPVGERAKNPKAAEMEQRLEEGLNAIGIGPQGLGGAASVLGVHIEHAARHPSTIGVAVNVGCWAHRRGVLHVDENLNCSSPTHGGIAF